jgi:hypothetical protein
MFVTRRGLFYRTDEGGGGSSGGGAGGDEKRKAEKAAVDQIADHEDRLSQLEGGFFERIATALKPAASATSQATGQVGTPVVKKKSVVDELAECIDPFGIFEEPQQPPKTEAPASDEAAA